MGLETPGRPRILTAFSSLPHPTKLIPHFQKGVSKLQRHLLDFGGLFKNAECMVHGTDPKQWIDHSRVMTRATVAGGAFWYAPSRL